MNSLISRYRAWFLVPCLALTSLSLAGCWDRTEVNDLALVTAAGIDRAGENAVELTVQVFVPRAGGGSQLGQPGSAAGDERSVVRSAKGKTIAEAMAKLQERFPRRIFWGHAEVFIIGEKVARTGIREYVDFFLRFSQPREHADIFVCKGEAKKVLELIPPLERHQAEVLRELSESKVSLHVTLKDLAEMLVGDAGDAALPYLTTLPPPVGKGQQHTIAYIAGTAVFRDDRMIGTLNQQKTRGLMWLRDEIKFSVVTLSPEEADGFISFYLLRSRTKWLPRIEGDRWSMTVEITTEDDVVENTTSLDLLDPEVTRALEAELEREIVRRIELTLKQVQQEMKVDIVGFAEIFHRRYPREWRKVQDRWDEKFPEVEVRVEVDAKILRPGVSGSMITRPKDERRNR